MTLVTDWTPEEKDIVEPFERNLRAWINTYASLLAQARSLADAANADGGPRDLITALDPDQIIKNTSGLAGAHPLTKAEISAVFGILDELIAASDNAADRELMKQAAGTLAGL